MKYKVRAGKRSHFSSCSAAAIFFFYIVDDSDFMMEKDQSVLSVMKDLLKCFIMKRGQYQDVLDTK